MIYVIFNIRVSTVKWVDFNLIVHVYSNNKYIVFYSLSSWLC